MIETMIECWGLKELQLPEKDKENFDVSKKALPREVRLPDEGPLHETSNFSFFQIVVIPLRSIIYILIL